jgi:hypothetical protein
LKSIERKGSNWWCARAPLDEAVVVEYARNKQTEEVIAVIALLANLSIGEIERLFLGSWTSPVCHRFQNDWLSSVDPGPRV